MAAFVGDKNHLNSFTGEEIEAIEKLTDVSETLLISLYARSLETKRVDSIIKDEMSIEIAKQIDFSKFSSMWSTQVGTAIRTEILDQETKAFLERSPNSTVVNLGAGLCTRFFRVDNGKVKWYELDLGEVRPVWEQFIGESDRHKYLAYSILNFSWMDQLKSMNSEKILFIAEGLLMYFTEDEVKKLIIAIRKNFPGSEMLIEALGPFMARYTKIHPAVSKTGARFKWGIKSLKELEKWSPGIEFIKEWYYLDRYRKRWGWIKFLRYVPSFRSELKIGHIRFENDNDI
jgi:O-methyltransferase involved in polyketide biosynthesis